MAVGEEVAEEIHQDVDYTPSVVAKRAEWDSTNGFLNYGKQCVQHSDRCIYDKKKPCRFVYSLWHSTCIFQSRRAVRR
jgi:hypothetical protein